MARFIFSQWFSPRHLLSRGESAVASGGLALVVIIVAATLCAGGWTWRTQRQVLQAARTQEIHAAGEMLSQSARVMLDQGDLTSVRRLVNEAAAGHRLTVCRILLPDGRVLADMNSRHVTAAQLPDSWGAGTFSSAFKSRNAGVLSYPLDIAGRGRVLLEIAGGGGAEGALAYWRAQAGVGTVGVIALIALLLIYHGMRKRLSGMGAIREALLAAAQGEKSRDALAVDPEVGPEAIAWNEVLQETDHLRRDLAQERLKMSADARRGPRQDLDAACDAMSQGLLLVDDHLRVKYANGAAAVFLKTRREAMAGGDLAQHLTETKVLEAITAVAAGADRQRSVIEVDRSQPPAGAEGQNAVPPPSSDQGVLRFSIRPVRRDDAAAAMVVIEDITQQRIAEQARNAFVAQATHELRTPLTNIRLYVETAIEDGDDDPASRANCLNVINQETRRLERIVGEMLSVAEMEAGSFRLNKGDIHLDSLLEDLKSHYTPQAADKKIELEFHLPPKLPVISGDRDKLLVALHNLLGNALKYTSDGGHVHVSADIKRGQVVIEVTDTGIGVALDEREKIFERFHRASDPRVARIGGTGLGLSLAREVVRMHGGEIVVDSELNKGSTFTLTLPALAEAA